MWNALLIFFLLFAPQGDARKEAESLIKTAASRAEAGDAEGALEQYRQALPWTRAAGDREMEAKVLSGIGAALTNLGEYQPALNYFEQCLALKKAIGDTVGEGNALNYIGYVYRMMDDPARAIEYYQRALPLFRKVKSRAGEGMILNNIGRASLELGARAQGLDYLQQSLQIGIELDHKLGQANILTNIGKGQAEEGRYKESLESLQKALTLRYAIGDKRGEAETLFQIARTEGMMGNFATARENIEKTIEISEALRARVGSQELRSSFFATRRLYYEYYVDLLMAQHGREPDKGYAALALAVSERARARSLIELLAEARTEIDQKGPQTITLPEIQRLLDADTLLMEYLLGAENSYLWVVSKEALDVYRLPKRAEIELVAKELFNLLKQRTAKSDNSAAGFEKLSARLSAMILAPAAARLQNKRLVIVSDGAIQYLPLGALPAPTKLPAYSPLVVENEIVSLPSATTLALIRQETDARQPAPGAVAVLADPIFNSNDTRLQNAKKRQGEQLMAARLVDAPLTRALRDAGSNTEELPRLLATRDEAEAIGTLVAPAERRLALGFAASKHTVTAGELARYRIVHFATHGLLDSARPELSGVVLSLYDEEGREQDGFLRLTDIYNLKLPAEMVVLSACQTGLGKEVRGEGLIGLTRGFMYAGARRVVASMWKIDDEATAELMKRFYQGVLKQGQSPAAALRSAQISFLKHKRWHAPFYWAAFIMQGEYR